jgi:cell shape-determining protein MreD
MTVRWPMVFFIFLLVVLHFVLRIGLGLGPLSPDLLVVAVLLAAREMRAGAAAGLGLLLGILDGAVVPYAMGASAVVLTVLGYFGSRTKHFVVGDGLAFLALYIFAGKWLFDLLLFVVADPASGRDIASLLLISPFAAVYAAIAGILLVAGYRVVT